MTQIQSSLLDYSYPGLPTDVWQADGILFPYHRDYILKLLNSFYNSYKFKNPNVWVTDIHISGSLTTNKFLRNSDMDVHIQVNIDKFIEANNPKLSDKEALKELDDARKEWDRAKILMPFTNHPLEIFFESPLNPSNDQMVGCYSVLQNKWLKEPIYFKQDEDFEEYRVKAVEEAKEIANELDTSFSEIDRQIQRIDELKEVLQAWPQEKRKLFYDKIQKKIDEIEEEIEKSIQIKEELVNYRHEHQNPLDDNELIFKFLARFQYFAIINGLKDIVGNEPEVTVDELPLIEKVISQASLNKKAYDWLGKGWWISPGGEEIELLPGEEHEDWMTQGDEEEPVHFGQLLQDGWVQIRNWGGSKTVEIGIYSFNNVQEGLNNFLVKHPFENISLIDYNGNRIQISYEDAIEHGVQKAINKALSHKRLQTASIKQASVKMNVKENKNKAELEFNLNGNKIGYAIVSWDPNYKEEKEYRNLYLEYIQVESEFQKKGYGKEAYNLVQNYAEQKGFNHIVLSAYENDSASFWKHMGFEPSEHSTTNFQKRISMQKFASFMKKANESIHQELNNKILVDFDGTIANDMPDNSIGEPINGVKEALQKLKNMGYELEIFSSRANDEKGLDEVKNYLDSHDIPYDSIFQGEKPLAKYYIDNSSIHFDNWDNVLKQVEGFEKKASSKIAAYNYRSEKVWLDPSGHWHQVGGSGSHADWILDNANMLKDEFGFDSSAWTRDSEGYIEDFVGLDQALIKTGWVRVGDAHSGWGIEVKDLHNIPDFVRDMLIGNRGEVTFEDVNENYVIVDINDYVTKGQKAVNRALQTRRLQPAFSKRYLNKIADSRYWVDPIGKVYPVNDTHADWIMDNEELVRLEVFEKHPEELYPEEKDNTDPIMNIMLRDGWLRVGDLFNISGEGKNYGKYFIGQGIEVADINNVPQSLFDFISNYGKDKHFIIEDLRKRYVELSVEELMADGQEAINRAMQRGKMIHASLSTKYWLDPQGRAYALDSNQTHPSWILDNLDLLHREGIDTEYESTGKISKEMFEKGWVRISTDFQGEAQFYIELGTSLNQLPSYVEGFVDKYFDPNDSRYIILESKANNQVAYIADPFPNLQNKVNKALRQKAMAKLFSKKEIISKIDNINYVGPLSNLEVVKDSTLTEKLLQLSWKGISGGIKAVLSYPTENPSDIFIAYLNNEPIAWIAYSYATDDSPLANSNIFVREDLRKQGIGSELRNLMNNFLNNKKESNLKQAQVLAEYDYNTTHFSLPKDLAEKVIKWGIENIADKDLMDDSTHKYGRELEPHISLHYRVPEKDYSDIAKMFEGFDPVKVKFGKTTFFSLPDNNNDAVVIEVESEDLQKLTKQLCEEIDCKEHEKEPYKPHVTVAYVKSGLGKNYVDKDILTGEEATLDTLFYILTNKKRYSVVLDKKGLSVLWKVNKIASDKRAWVDPNGKVFYTGGDIHASWVNDNLEFLERDYGFHVSKRVYNQRMNYYKLMEEGEENVDLPDIWDVMEEMYNSGWVRIGDASGYGEVGIELKDLRSIPTYLDNILPQFVKNGQSIFVEDRSHNSVEIFYPFKSLQQAVNKALSSPTKTASGNNFYPSLVQAPDNRWQFEHGGDDQEIPVDPDPVSDEQTYFAPCTVGKPRNPDMWRQLWHMIKSPFSKKEVESDSDSEQEVIEQKELGENETLLEYTKHFKDLNRLDTNKPKTTWPDNSSSQGGEPYAPLPSFHVETNPDNENWRYPWKYVSRPRGEDSDDGKTIEMLQEQEKRKACIERMTREITADLPPQQFIPEHLNAGTAIQTDDGSIYWSDEPHMIHVKLIKQLGIPAERIVSGGRIVDGTYIDAGIMSDTMRYVEREMARKRVEEKRKSMAKQAGTYSASVPDYQGEQWGNEQRMDNGGEVSYVNKDHVDNGYGFRDFNDSSTDYPKPEDIEPAVVHLDILNKPINRTDPFGMTWYSVVLYDAAPMSNGIESVNPD